MDPLLAEVLRDPDDSAARIVYADQLQTAGDPRGELIAVSCALATLADDDPRRPAIARRELALLRAHLPAWATALGLDGAYVGLVRGFPDRIDTQSLRTAITDRIPLTTLTLRGMFDSHAAAIAQATAAPTLRSLAVVHVLEDPATTAPAAIAASPWLAQLRKLRVFGLPVDDAGALALVGNQLQSLELGSSRNEVKLTRKGLDALLAAPGFARLRSFSLKQVALKVPGARCFTKATLPNLEMLELEQCKLGSEGAALVLGSSTLPALRTLSLRVNTLADGEVPTVGPALARTLRRLELSLCDITDAWIRQFLVAGPLAIEHLGLRSNRLTAAGVRALLESNTLPALTALSVASQHREVRSWGPELASIVALPGFARLRGFDADHAGVTADGVIALASSPHARALRNLRLGYSATGAAGAEAIGNSDMLGNLESLDLGSAKLGDAGIERLCASTRLSRLRYLALNGNGIGERGFAALLRTEAFPQLRVLRLYEANERRSALEQHLGAFVDVGDRIESMGRWPEDDFLA